MYFLKTRKHLEAQEANETAEKNRQRDRYQRSDSARLVLQALPQQSRPEADDGQVSRPASSTEPAPAAAVGSAVDPSTEFKPDELPDGACYRPNKDLKNLPITKAKASSYSVFAGSSTQDASAAHSEHMEYVRAAEVSSSPVYMLNNINTVAVDYLVCC